MPTPNRARPTSTKMPTRNSPQVTCCLCAILPSSLFWAGCKYSPDPCGLALHQEPLQIIVVRIENVLRGAVKVDSAIAQDQEIGGRAAVAGRRARDLLAVRIEPVVGQTKGVLQAVRGQQR